ncbi:hypothetical protein DMN91_008124 [Ooceraea biroi]|uniref:SPT2 homolog N-terminal domain-containing protein n=1 Tax=Ooceraea biroi TaxID=2015173 RepID=A0A3L8DGJ3_OOCBI|nr:hypothetical protein DMN91_008124 [Ooceraea biroi]
MDFSTLISVAKDNETSKQTAPCYRTKFAPPKKQTKQSKTLSENIKKFLARKEEEERHKALEEKKKKDNLLSLRDHKAQSRINKHLKVCKAANKSVIADAIDNENTAITMAEKPIFNDNEKRTPKDIATTKDRVKQALKQQELEENNGHRRKRKSSALNAKETQVDKKPEKSIDDKVKEEDKSNKPKPERKMLPPPMEFAELLKLAEKKQHEPVIIEIKPKVDDGRPMTKRQKKEWEYLQEKEKRERERANLQKTSNTSVPKKPTKIQLNKIPKKLGNPEPNSNSTQNKNSLKDIVSVSKKVIDKPNDKHSPGKAQSIHKDDLLEERRRLEVEKRHLEEMRRAIEEEKRKLVETKSKQASTKSQPLNVIAAKSKTVDKQVSSKNTKSRLFQSEDLKPSSFLSSKKSGQSPPLNIKSVKSKQVAKKPLTFDKKRRIYDDNDDEYDSDLDDFIDDGTEEDHEDYSKHISEIFGYDKNKYQHMDDEDDTAMESNFAQQLKEEYVSTKIGICLSL